MDILGLIPARGGSKGIIGKNTRMIAGKPLIAWTIEQALAAQQLNRVVVTTDDDTIASISRQYGAQVPFIRPVHLADDTCTTESAMVHALHWLSEHQDYRPDAVMLLQCTSPVRHQERIDQAIDQYQDQQLDSLVSVTPFWHFLWQDKHHPKALYDYKHRPRRQDIDSKQIQYKENGSIYISDTHGLMSSNNRLFGRIGLFIMADDEGHEIDTELDLHIVTSILASRHTGQSAVT